jgi:hypothetical protein
MATTAPSIVDDLPDTALQTRGEHIGVDLGAVNLGAGKNSHPRPGHAQPPSPMMPTFMPGCRPPRTKMP